MRSPTLGLLLLASCASSPSSATAPLHVGSGVVQTLGDGSRAAVARSPLTPLFFGTEPDGLAATITSGPHFYAVSLHREGHTLALHGVDMVHAAVEDEADSEGAPPSTNATVRGQPATVLVNEAIRSVAWEEAGGYWALEVECDRPFDDPRCTEDDYLLSEAEALIDLRSAP